MSNKTEQFFSISGGSGVDENVLFSSIYNGETLSDIANLAGKTPLDDLIEKEEAESMGTAEKEEYAIMREAIGGLLAFLFKPDHRGFIPTPVEVSIRAFTLAYSINPEIINNMTMNEIGKLFDLTRNRISERVIAQDHLLNLRARGRKSETQRENLSVATKSKWNEKKAELKREYVREWKRKNKLRVKANNQRYYQEKRKIN